MAIDRGGRPPLPPHQVTSARHNRLRAGWPAPAIDVACGAVAFAAIAGRPFGLPAVLLIALTGLVAAGVRLYHTAGQATWPLRLVAAIVGGTLGAAVLLPVVAPGAPLDAPALAAYGALVFLLATSWRVADGVRFRRARRRARASRQDAEPLVEQGAELATMSGGVGHVWRYRHLLRNLVAKHLTLKYRGSLLGFAWTLVAPLTMSAVYVLAFTYVVKVGTPRFALYLLVGLLAWNYFSGAITASVDAIAGGGALLKSVAFPRVVLPFAVVLFHLVQYGLTLVVLLPVLLFAYDVPLSLRLFAFPAFLALQTVFIAGLALGLSTATALFRDVRHLVDLALGIGFWATPIVYEMRMVPESAAFAVLLSPATSYIRAYQDIFYYGVAPDGTLWMVAVTYAVAAFACGLSMFLAREAQFSELV